MKGPYADLKAYCRDWDGHLGQPIRDWQKEHPDRRSPDPPYCDPQPAGVDQNSVVLAVPSPPFLAAHLFASTGYEYPLVNAAVPTGPDSLFPAIDLAFRTRAGWYVLEEILQQDDYDHNGCSREGAPIIFRLAVQGRGARGQLVLRLLQGSKRWPIVSCVIAVDGAPRCQGKRLNTMRF